MAYYNIHTCIHTYIALLASLICPLHFSSLPTTYEQIIKSHN